MEQLTLFQELFKKTPAQKTRRRKPSEEYDACVRGLEESFRRHVQVLAEGTCDPFYPDGVNANLVRNHIIYYKKRLEEICSQTLLPLPDAYYRLMPEEVDHWYMAPGSKAMRARREEHVSL